MAGTAVRRRLTWQVATVASVTRGTASVRTLGLRLPDWRGHRAGQHLDVRLTAEDGYRAEREYSIASAPGEPVAVTVERLEDGEVSPYLTEEVRVGDELELRGPVGGYFVWNADDGGPLMLVAGGSVAHRFRRDRRCWAGRARLPARAGEDRAVRGDRRTLMDALDGNAIAGLLQEVFVPR